MKSAGVTIAALRVDPSQQRFGAGQAPHAGLLVVTIDRLEEWNELVLLQRAMQFDYEQRNAGPLKVRRIDHGAARRTFRPMERQVGTAQEIVDVAGAHHANGSGGGFDENARTVDIERHFKELADLGDDGVRAAIVDDRDAELVGADARDEEGGR